MNAKIIQTYFTFDRYIQYYYSVWLCCSTFNKQQMKLLVQFPLC